MCGGEFKALFVSVLCCCSGVEAASGGCAGDDGGVVRRTGDLTRGRFRGRPRFDGVLTSGEEVPCLLLVIRAFATLRFATLHSDLSGETIRARLDRELVFEI